MTTTSASPAAPARQSRAPTNTNDSTMTTATITRRGRASASKFTQPSSPRPCHNGRKPKGPVCRNAKSVEVAAPTVKRGFVMSELVRPALARAGMVAGKMGLSARTTARLRTCYEHLAHPLPVVRPRVVLKSPVGATMTVISLAARTAAPITLPAGRTAAPTFNDTTDPAQIALHAAAENALATALHLLRDPSGTAADLQRATARAIRAATLLKRACAAQEGAAA